MEKYLYLFINCNYEMNESQSQFNMAISFLNRLNLYFFQCADSAMRLDAYTWFHTLRGIYREMADDMKHDERKIVKDQIDALIPLIDNWVRQSNKGLVKIDSQLYEKLDSLEICLREAINKAGYKTKYVNSASMALQ